MTDTAKLYSVKSIFYTIQGEGMRAGTAAVFVRFTGCNLWAGTQETRERGKGACAQWCDTDFTKEGATKLSAQTIVTLATKAMQDGGGNPKTPHSWVVFTGGEPFLQLDRELVNAFRDIGWRVAVETNGHTEPTCLVDWLCCSPKMNADGTVPELKVQGADELKIVLGGPVEWPYNELMKFTSEYGTRWKWLVLNPLDSWAMVNQKVAGPKTALPIANASLSKCINFVQCHPQWRMGVQMHKMIGVE